MDGRGICREGLDLAGCPGPIGPVPDGTSRVCAGPAGLPGPGPHTGWHRLRERRHPEPQDPPLVRGPAGVRACPLPEGAREAALDAVSVRAPCGRGGALPPPAAVLLPGRVFRSPVASGCEAAGATGGLHGAGHAGIRSSAGCPGSRPTAGRGRNSRTSASARGAATRRWTCSPRVAAGRACSGSPISAQISLPPSGSSSTPNRDTTAVTSISPRPQVASSVADRYSGRPSPGSVTDTRSTPVSYRKYAVSITSGRSPPQPCTTAFVPSSDSTSCTSPSTASC